jgi:hypothetical protein
LSSNFPFSIPFTQLRTRWAFIIKNSRVNGHWALLTRSLPLWLTYITTFLWQFQIANVCAVITRSFSR